MTIRFKLTMGAIAAILVANSLLALIYVVYLERNWQQEVQTRVRLDLNSARRAYDNHAASISRAIAAAAFDWPLAGDLTRPASASSDAIESWTRRFAKSMGIDFVAVLDARGRVVAQTNATWRRGDRLARTPVVDQAIEHGKLATGSILTSADASGGERMAVAAATPLRDAQRRIVGFLYAGDVLNDRHDLVDAIKKDVFPPGTHKGKEIGTVTIFQSDRRIATNVVGADDRRAVGTRMSEAVAQEVLQRGGTWAAPAFVVDDWYITAYEPIRDPAGRIIGALYVGLLQAPFAHAWTSVVLRFLILTGAATTGSLILIYLVTMVVMRPIGRIVAMSRRVIAGDLSARVGIRPPGEIGLLCRAVDGMADAVAQREEQLKQAVRQQVTRAEKLASIGRLAAGVAHEINNPLTGVLTFAHLLREKPNMDEQDRQDLDLVIHETTRAADIVRGLLDFARERPTLMEPLDINDVVQRTVRLIANQKKFDHIVIRQTLDANLPEVRGDRNQLQQVLLNLSLNACTAMPQGGELAIRTFAAAGRVGLEVRDTGCGIKEELLDKIFEPFFTTQEVGKGTGLGLSVTFGIVEGHGGELTVESQEGKGSTFTVLLPALDPSAPSSAT